MCKRLILSKENEQKKRQERLFRAASVLLFLLCWQLAASAVGISFLLASPLQVLWRFMGLLKEKEFWLTLFCSGKRLVLGFGAAFLLGTALGLLAGFLHPAELLLSPWLQAAKTVPTACFIILFLLWFPYSRLTAFTAFLVAFPQLYGAALQGVKGADPKLREMAQLYGIRPGCYLLYIVLPSVKQQLQSAGSSAVGMACKAGVAAEIIGIAEGTVGEKLYEAKVYFQNEDLLAWTLALVLLGAVLERLYGFLLDLLYKGVERL